MTPSDKNPPTTRQVPLPESSLLKKLGQNDFPTAISFELTARCNNNCRHCYINLPAGDRQAQAAELDLAAIESLADQAVRRNVLWCLLTGGEPLLRPDFADIYLALKKKGLLISVFTNACLVTSEHVTLFKRYAPRDLEVTVYGVTQKTYERVTGVKGSFAAFQAGLDRLLTGGIPVTLKAMAMRSNVHEIEEIAAFCTRHSKKSFRFDPFLHKRYDGNAARNRLIEAERLTEQEIIQIEQNNQARRQALLERCEQLIFPDSAGQSRKLFWCGILRNGLEISYDGQLRLCSALRHPDYCRDLKNKPLETAYREIAATIIAATAQNENYATTCGSCTIVNLCQFCPAHSYLETGRLDAPVEIFCTTAAARKKAIRQWQQDATPPGKSSATPTTPRADRTHRR